MKIDIDGDGELTLDSLHSRSVLVFCCGSLESFFQSLRSHFKSVTVLTLRQCAREADGKVKLRVLYCFDGLYTVPQGRTRRIWARVDLSIAMST